MRIDRPGRVSVRRYHQQPVLNRTKLKKRFVFSNHPQVEVTRTLGGLGRGGSKWQFFSFYCLWEPQTTITAMGEFVLTLAVPHCRRIVGQWVDFAWKIPVNFLEEGKKAPSTRVSWKVSAAERTERYSGRWGIRNDSRKGVIAGGEVEMRLMRVVKTREVRTAIIKTCLLRIWRGWKVIMISESFYICHIKLGNKNWILRYADVPAQHIAECVWFVDLWW